VPTSPPFRRDRARLPAAERRRQILEMTTKLIAERGFWGLSMQDVADGCGLTVPGMLHHVGSKDSLLVAVLEYRDEQDARSLAEKLGRPAHRLWADGRITLAEVCDAVVRRNAEQPEIVRLFAVLGPSRSRPATRRTPTSGHASGAPWRSSPPLPRASWPTPASWPPRWSP
jgi:AcrR family transcriptional regulator